MMRSRSKARFETVRSIAVAKWVQFILHSRATEEFICGLWNCMRRWDEINSIDSPYSQISDKIPSSLVHMKTPRAVGVNYE